MNKQAFRRIASSGRLIGRLRERLFQPARPHRVYLSFARSETAENGWHCIFRRDDLPKTPLSKRFIFRGSEKIYQTAERGHGITGKQSRDSLDQAVALGRGEVWLRLTKQQYASLEKWSSGV
ncbi:MAG: hypothetical protein WBY53_20485 [Acidobacteriaceae bacterium]